MVSQKLNLEKNILINPFIYKSESIGFESIKIVVLLMIQVFMLFFTKSYSALLVILFSCLGSVIAEVIARFIFKQKEHYSFVIAILQGLTVGMMIPETYSIITVFFTVMLSMLAVKHLFGGFAYTWLNPCVFIVAVLWFVGGKLFPDFLVTSDYLCMRNPSQLLIESGAFPISSFDSSLTEGLNNLIFNLFKVSIPEGYVSLFWDTHSVIPAFRFNFITLVSSLLLFSPSLIKSIIPGTFVITYLILVRLILPFFCNGVPFQGDMLLALLTSGTLFYAVFVLQSYGTIPSSIVGKIVYGVIAGIAAFFITGCGTSSIGMCFTILFANISSLFIQNFEDKFNRKKVEKLLSQVDNKTIA